MALHLLHLRVREQVLGTVIRRMAAYVAAAACGLQSDIRLRLLCTAHCLVCVHLPELFGSGAQRSSVGVVEMLEYMFLQDMVRNVCDVRVFGSCLVG